MGVVAWFTTQVHNQTVTQNVIDHYDSEAIRLHSQGKMRYRGAQFGVTGRTVQLIMRFGYTRVYTAIKKREHSLRRQEFGRMVIG